MSEVVEIITPEPEELFEAFAPNGVWGYIGGNIQDQADLIDLINSIHVNLGPSRIGYGDPATGDIISSDQFTLVFEDSLPVMHVGGSALGSTNETSYLQTSELPLFLQAQLGGKVTLNPAGDVIVNASPMLCVTGASPGLSTKLDQNGLRIDTVTNLLASNNTAPLEIGTAAKIRFRDLVGLPTYSALYIGLSAPSSANYTWAANGSETVLNAPNAADAVTIAVAGDGVAAWRAGDIRMSVQTIIGDSGMTILPTAMVDIMPSTVALAHLRLRSGLAPVLPNNGDIWFDGTNLKMRIGGVTRTFTLV